MTLLTSRINRVFIFLFVAFLVVFPKGGFKLGNIPITWGYVLLGVFFGIGIIHILASKIIRINKNRFMIYVATLPFQFISLITVLLYGYTDLGLTISLFITFSFLPILFIHIIGFYIDRINLEYLLKLIKSAVLLVSVYGVILFFYKLITGEFIEIPYLTINAGDLGELDEKHIDRGGVFKLISTYNNGNIYAVSILMLIPLYYYLEKNFIKRSMVNLSIILTLSRTAWLGLVLFHVFNTIFIQKKTFKNILKSFILFLLILFGVIWALNMMGLNSKFIFDSQLGGRSEQLSYFDNFSLFPNGEFGGIGEIVYASILNNFGLIGLFLFLLSMCYFIYLIITKRIKSYNTEYKKSIVLGLVLYLILSMSDGAILLIPVMVFYWFLLTLLVSNNESFNVEEKRKKRRLFPKITL